MSGESAAGGAVSGYLGAFGICRSMCEMITIRAGRKGRYMDNMVSGCLMEDDRHHVSQGLRIVPAWDIATSTKTGKVE